MRADIEKYLGTVLESTAKTISHKLGLPQLDVSRELNGMVKDGTLEREMRKGEYAYWLTRADAGSNVSVETEHQIAPVEMAADSPARSLVANEFRAADLSVRDLCELLGVDFDKSVTPVADAIEAARLKIQCASDAMTALDAERSEVESQKKVIATLRANNAALEQKIDELTIVDAEFVPAQVFVTIGRHAEPKRHRTLEKAQRRAHLLVRSERESEVLVLEPVGRVVRGAEWRSQ
ncbi:1-pyrroline-5-carboxylate dehydrogenase [Paraburkholderia sp. D15]|uniref:1-pyrroline-5-carboxylate dehydrogenase n=1 Tax=Paraburkholderia sp. D15 TaxID=2880218 RepID=UPI00247906FD|nr:1-pyrroline-5-carboxylate dehydrogenase [Paraburkholderia sp. D15]WGS53530.1 1-pyrroline-5-carboxylate dehydrogenase [Paraburkholderia sp. D15]